jgi:hypothetical protein
LKNNWEEIFKTLKEELPVVFKQKRYTKKTVLIVQVHHAGKNYGDKTTVAKVLLLIYRISEKFPKLSSFRILSSRGTLLFVYTKPVSQNIGTGSSTGDAKVIENWNKMNDGTKQATIKLLEAQINSVFGDTKKKKKKA